MKKLTQNEKILALLIQRGALGITPLDVLYQIGSFRLAARIFDLRKKGYVIGSMQEPGKSYDRYWLVEMPE